MSESAQDEQQQEQPSKGAIVGGCIVLLIGALLLIGLVWLLIGAFTNDTTTQPASQPAPTTARPTTSAPAPTGTPEPVAAADICQQLDQLPVEPEHTSGYDRDLFGDYDRDALLQASLDRHGDYYSPLDDTHHDDPGDVHVDHMIALAEAWESGAHTWNDQQRQEFAADPDNLVLLTAEVNMSKSAQDVTEWLPPHDPATADYINTWITTKNEYGLSADQSEIHTLKELTGC